MPNFKPTTSPRVGGCTPTDNRRRRRILIKNKTHWRTDHIQTFVRRAAAMILDPHEKRVLTVTVVYTKHNTGGSSGCAWLGGSSLTVRLPRRLPDKIDFAHVIAHELGHCRGLTHRQMRGAGLYCRGEVSRRLYAWAGDLPLERKAPRVKPKLAGADPVTAKLENARRKVAEWERKARLATSRAKRWSKKVRYHESRLVRLNEGKSHVHPNETESHTV